MLKFDSVEEKELIAFKGGLGSLRARMLTDELNKILMGRLESGSSIGLHTHGDSSEIMYFISGTGRLFHNGKEEKIVPGDCHYCKKGESHTVINDGEGDLVFFAVVPNQ
ncbi:MAG: cupin domain-containing protein [Ruminococcaceae bacterium]|nr:cupin domain-containing protein [Oscillospiraceae bacterium]